MFNSTKIEVFKIKNVRKSHFMFNLRITFEDQQMLIGGCRLIRGQFVPPCYKTVGGSYYPVIYLCENTMKLIFESLEKYFNNLDFEIFMKDVRRSNFFIELLTSNKEEKEPPEITAKDFTEEKWDIPKDWN